MLQWDELHPYNTMHVARIPHALDLERLRNAIDGTLESLGLTSLTLDERRGTFHYHGGPAPCEIEMVTGGGGWHASLCLEIERQLNTAFPHDKCFNPFRFFVVPETDSFSLGLVCLHAVAGGRSLVLLMKDIVGAYTRENAPEPAGRVDLCPPNHDNLLRHHPLALAKKLSAVPAFVKAMKSSCRPPYRDAEDLHNGFTSFSLKTGSLPALIRAGKCWGVTLNDLFFAVMMKCFSRLASGRRGAPRRRNISVGCIVDIRKDLGLDRTRAFGIFLGSFVVTHEVPDAISLMDLAQDIRRQTLAIKKDKLYLGLPLELAFARLILPVFPPARREKLYRTNYPLWGAITNIDLDAGWGAQDREKPVGYIRAGPTGPITPLLLSVTTFRDTVNIGLTYRSTVFSAPQIEWMKSCLLDSPRHLEGRV